MSVAPPVTIVLGAVTLGNVKTSLLGSVVTEPGVPGAGEGGGLLAGAVVSGGRRVKEAPPVTNVVGAVTWGSVNELVPMMMTLPLEIMVSPRELVVVSTLVISGGVGA